MIQKDRYQNNTTVPPRSPASSHLHLKDIDFNHLLSDSLLHSSRRESIETLQENQHIESIHSTQAENQDLQGQHQETLHSYYEQALALIHAGQYSDASAVMQKAIFVDLDSRLPTLIVKSCDFWDTRLRKIKHLPILEMFTAVHEAWIHFNKNIVRKDAVTLDRVVHAIRMQVFGLIVDQLRRHPEVEQDIHYAFALARAYKYRGDYDEAIDVYALVLEIDAKNPAALAELADCYAIIDEETHAKVLFREAFFHGPDRIVMSNLDSVMIKQLERKMQDLHLPEVYIPEWMAVYGVVWGLLIYSRELSKSEYARLNHSIHALRAQVEEHPEKRGYLVPRLIYRLFWLIDYFIANEVDAGVTRQNIEKVLIEIKFLDEKIYKKYKL
ncbi:hypothetical protein PVA45_03080 [Entomospira entomophila]|uniref:Tetratricopeptide repeat protein n=1 Tax=Entomospira entomophila TaxID=2719988 RepID=A0A968G8G1_9SPIO|nr:tetratricopeptide repeat protein [Entomospira entomophilus]NIZ40497.1 hypothetical protein [Entomospira entomophilus]WDI36056.1 hypothetical protein PVA45_03080 [Entomospira entomophilus]